MSPRFGFYTTERLGPTQSLTPEGFLLCVDVPIARTGMMVYGPDETPIKAGPDGIVKIFREAEDVFSPETIASYAGKSVVIDHPEDDVSPENWKELEVGVCLNPRRGLGVMDDLLLGDFLVKDPDAIRMIQEEERREVSCGYEADYVETAPGVGKQTNIIGNHIALVEQGRCGPRCKIGDHQPKKGNIHMAKKITWDSLLKVFGVKDAAELQEKLSQDEGEVELTGSGEEQHIHIHPGPAGESDGYRVEDDETFQAHVQQNQAEHEEFRQRLEALEAALAGNGTGDEEDPEMEKQLKEESGVNDEAELEQVAKAKDSRYLADSFQDTVAMAEILVPGIRIPTFDKAARPGDSFKGICKFRRSALDQAYAGAARAAIDEVLGGKTLNTKTMNCATVRSVFRASAALQKNQNNHQVHDHHFKQTQVKAGINSLAALNKANAERYKTNS